jgi:hypothetical protein
VPSKVLDTASGTRTLLQEFGVENDRVKTWGSMSAGTEACQPPPPASSATFRSLLPVSFFFQLYKIIQDTPKFCKIV